MKTNKLKKFTSLSLLSLLLVNTLNPITALEASSNSDIIYPLKEISKLECRFNDFSELSSDCKQDLPILKTSDYQKYSTQNGWYNDYTRLYTVLWWSSYTYGWDVWNGWHMWVDIATAKWTPVYAISEGTVIIASELNMLWNTVAIKHTINWKEVVSSYSHMSLIDAKKWDKVKAWTKIWEVWSTWNSTGNHLHFQIDIDTSSPPAYYSYESCPYSYYKISEEWVCFGELEKLTVDPLAFLETKGAALSNITTTSTSSSTKNTTKTNTTTSNNSDLSIFEKTVYVWYSAWDIREVQQIYKALWYYKGDISSDYNDVLESVIDYQVDKWVIASRNATGAGWFGPATRAQTKKDYESYIAKWWEETKTYITTNTQTVTTSTTQKISKASLMTREEIEKREVEDFQKNYNINLNFEKAWTNIAVWNTETLKLDITNRKWKAFKWSLPWDMTFIVNTETANVFPTKLYYFTDWKRDIQVTWLKEWSTKLYVKIWTVTIKTFDLKIYNWKVTIYPTTASVVSPNSAVIWDTNTAIAVFKDSSNNKLVNLEFGSTYKLKASEWNKVCIKTGTLKNIKSVYTSKCDDDEFKEEITFTYKDTVGWLLIYDYKTLNKNAKFEIINTYNSSNLANKTVKVNNPKWLATSYEYKTEVLTTLEQWITSWISKWYFLENRELTEYDAYTWIENSLNELKVQNIDQSTKNTITTNLKEIDSKQKSASKYNTITRWQFLALTYKYLIINQSNVELTKTYKDLSEDENKIVNYIFNKNITWKDQFGDSYFQPKLKITRWEWAYMLSNIFNNYTNNFLTLK